MTTRDEALAAVKTLISFIDPDPEREGLARTPERVVCAWEKFWGVGVRTERSLANMTMFKEGYQKYDEMLVVRGIPVYSHCEHHLTPFFGSAAIGYIPRDGVILGLSKFTRVVNAYARRLQTQEYLTCQIAQYLWGYLRPVGLGVVLQCRHLCMESRGVERSGEETITSALWGDFKTESETRSEFLSLARRSEGNS